MNERAAEYHQWENKESPSVQRPKVCDEPKRVASDELPGSRSDTERCYYISSEQLNAYDQLNPGPAVKSTHPSLLKSDRKSRDTNSCGKVNRAHISEFFHYEEDAPGIESSASDLPMYQWDWDSSQPTLVGRSVNDRKNINPPAKQTSSTTSYIPTPIYGAPEFVKQIQAVCTKCLSVFNTLLSTEPALVEPM